MARVRSVRSTAAKSPCSTSQARRAKAFVREWAADHGLGDAEILVWTGDVETAIERAAADLTMVIVGATRKGLLSRLLGWREE